MQLQKKNKLWNNCQFWRTALLATMLIPAPAQAVESPLSMIRMTVERAMAVLKNPAYQGEANFQRRIEKLEEIVLPRLDPLEFSRRCLGTQWQQLSAAQQQEFISLFKALIEKSYGGVLDRYSKGVEFSYDEERIEGTFAEVDTRVINTVQNKQFSIVYRLHQKEGKWLIYDIVVENVSMVRNYRNQFSRILHRSSYDGLVQALKRKIQQLDTAPTS